MRLFVETRIWKKNLNHSSTYAWYICQWVVDIKVFKICRPHCSVATLCGTDNGSCHFHCTVLTVLCAAGVCLCLFFLLNVVYLQVYVTLELIVGMTKHRSNCKEADRLTIHYVYHLIIWRLYNVMKFTRMSREYSLSKKT